jgi:sulfur-oxidizing protein SoxZ
MANPTTNPTRIRATVKDGVTDVRVRMSHVMETGQRKTASGALVPAHYITDLSATHNDRVVLSARFGPSVSANPYLTFKFRGGAKGDRIRLSWTDNTGDSRSDEEEIA